MPPGGEMLAAGGAAVPAVGPLPAAPGPMHEKAP